jgi:hypothetical protein
MPITIKGIRVDELKVAKDVEHGGFKVENAVYSLISSVDKVLAKQNIGVYGSLTLEPSPATVKALDAFMNLYIGDVQSLLGLAE